jgi:hypothetical protein
VATNVANQHTPLTERFWSKVEKSDGCWSWQGAIGYYGYGVIRRQYKIVLAHRVAYELTYGDAGDLDVLHRCDNPLCVRPDHLFLGTHADNMHDMAHKGRHKHREHRLSPAERRALCLRYTEGGITHVQLAAEYDIAIQSVARLIRKYRAQN